MRRLAALLGIVALGPVTGPLTAGLLRAIDQRRPVLAALYLVAIPAAWSLLATAAAWAGRTLT